MTSKTSQPNFQIATQPDGRALHHRPGRRHARDRNRADRGQKRRRVTGRTPGEQMTATPAPADQRSATRVVFPEPRRAELEEVIVDRELGPHEVVVLARRSVISPGIELAHYRGDSFVGLLPPSAAPIPTSSDKVTRHWLTPAVTARLHVPCGGSCSPAWALIRATRATPSAERPKGNPGGDHPLPEALRRTRGLPRLRPAGGQRPKLRGRPNSIIGCREPAGLRTIRRPSPASSVTCWT